ncbi:MAG: tRNA (adenosine(37)-N6)-dimethylallyltransferase MiaA [Lacipirellulaceae bacterium]
MPLFDPRDCWCLTGATASGKTAVALALAERLAGGAEVLSLDSMAVYRGMDIGTAKPTAAERTRVRTHLVDLRDPDEEFSVAEYLAEAERALADVRSRGVAPLFVGGTPLYLKCLLRGLFEGPGADWDLRHEIEEELEHAGLAALHERLTMVDPVAASTIHPNDARRIVRALEVFRATGEPISHRQLEFEDPVRAECLRVFALRRERDDQHRRIESRVDAMVAEGLIDEVRALTSGGSRLGRSASQAVGYRETLEHLGGEHDLATTVERMRVRTRRFAKRQGTWFRSLAEVQFIDVAPDDAPEAIAERVLALAR